MEGLAYAVPFDPLKCIARFNVQYRKDWCVVEMYPEEQCRDLAPSPEVLRVSTYLPGVRGI
jgi:hypothetical protein